MPAEQRLALAHPAAVRWPAAAREGLPELVVGEAAVAAVAGQAPAHLALADDPRAR